MRVLKLLTLLLLIASTAHAQKLLEFRPKVIEVGYRGFTDYQTLYSDGQPENKFVSDQLFTVRLGVPVILKEKTLFGLQLKYLRQQYNTIFIPQDNDNIYRYLNEKKLVNTGVNFLFQRKLDDQRKLTFMGVTELASDTSSVDRYSARYLLSAAYNVRKSEKLELGYGLIVNYALGVLNVYPTLAYNRALSSKMMIESFLPSYASLRYHPSEKAYLILKAQFDNWRFNVTNALSQEQNQLTLQRADFIMSLAFEREIHDWLWATAEASYVNNVAYIISLPGERLNNPIQEYKLKDAGYLKFSLVVVPPKKLWDKAK